MIALVRALVLSQRKKVNIYMNPKYAFMVAHRATWKERGLLTLGNKIVKHVEEILQLLVAVICQTRLL